MFQLKSDQCCVLYSNCCKFLLFSVLLLQMCVPLILQNKLSLAESFVAGHSHLEKHLVTLLDSWCQPSFSVEEICRWGSWRGLLGGGHTLLDSTAGLSRCFLGRS